MQDEVAVAVQAPAVHPIRDAIAAFLVGVLTWAPADTDGSVAVWPGRAGRSVRVLCATLAVIAASIYVAFLLVDAILRSNPSSQLVTIGGSLTLIAAAGVAKELVTRMRDLWHHVVRGSAVDAFSTFLSLSVATLGIAAPAWAFVLDEGRLGSASGAKPIYLVRTSDSPPAFHYSFPLAGAPPDWGRGAVLNAEQQTNLQQLAATLAACAGEDTSEGVVVDILGFADANEFKPGAAAGMSSSELNRQLANRRARHVGQRLSAALASQSARNVRIRNVVEWSADNPGLMAQHPRYFNARPLKETEQRDQGAFNRRADVVVVRAGSCAVHSEQ